MLLSGERGPGVLLVLNLLLQALDGVATWVGLQSGFGEGNPLLAWAIAQLGAAPALALFKLEACACLVLVWSLRRHRIAAPALIFCAVVYAACAVGPWAAALAHAHIVYAAS